MFSIILPSMGGPFSFEVTLPATIIGICLLIPGIIVWLYHRNTYSFLGFRRFQMALSITALELSNLRHQRVEAIISPIYPAEYEYLTLFTAVDPGNLLKRIEGLPRDPETLAAMLRQSDRFTLSITGLAGAMTLLGGLLLLPIIGFMFLTSGALNLFFLPLNILILIIGTVFVLYVRHRLRALKEAEPDTAGLEDTSRSAVTPSAECSVEDVLSLIQQGFSHPLRLLVVKTYSDLEYTGRVYYTGNGIELREAYLLPATAINRGDS